MTRPRPDERLRTAFEEHSTRVLAYALRHVDPSTAQDVVAEVFLVAWRRIDRLPEQALPWLLVVARNTIANRRRSMSRQQRLAAHMAGMDRVVTAPGADETAMDRAAMLAALAELSTAEREALLLVAWDGLSAKDAAHVAGCSTHAFEVRLHRARARLRRELGDERGTGHTTPIRTILEARS